MLAAIRGEKLDSGRRVDWIGTHELPAALGSLDDDVEAVVIPTRDRVSMRWYERTDWVANQIAVECNWPRSREQQHLVVAGALASELPAKSFLQVAENTANDC